MKTDEKQERSERSAERAPSLWKLSGITWAELLRRTWRQFQKDRILDQSAKLSFYFLLSTFPLLLFLITLLGLLLRSGPEFQATLQKYLAALVPSSASGLIDKTLGEINAGSGGGRLSLSLLFTLWTASRGVVAIMEGLNIACGVGDSRPWWKKNLVALGLTLVLLILIAAALFAMIYGSRYGANLGNQIGARPLMVWVWRVLTWMLPLAFVLLAFNILYLYAPNVKHRRWHWLMPGTVAGVMLWLAVSFGFKLYLTCFDRYSVTYGSIGAVIILLMWFYLSAIAFLLGGEVNSELEKTVGPLEQS
ncbi:MAG: YihY/virulence factor BrkB family protein [Opitutus sp.]